ncbi:MAG: ribonuclease Y [Planctomycetia bacterium]|nr:ribonuclease Y [Planctomycetia bacterium]
MMISEIRIEYVVVLAVLVLGLLVVLVVSMLMRTRKAKELEAKAEQDLLQAEREARNILKEAQVAAKEDVLKARETFEASTQTRREEIRELERRLAKREDGVERKMETAAHKERTVVAMERRVAEKEGRIKQQLSNLERTIAQEKEQLYRISGLGRDEARALLLQRLESDVEHEASAMIQRITEQARETAGQKVNDIIVSSMQRLASDITSHSTVSTVDLPNDEMKGRVIGREGRNIRAFEKATGIDVIVDDTPGVVVVSGFDSVRREVAARSMAKLIHDGRIHPARIEQVVAETAKEVNQQMVEAGKQAVMDTGVRGLHPKEVALLGRLHFRTSYGQNCLKHSVEVASLSAMLAAELGLNEKLAKRAGLLHDIGKAVDHEVEGGHPEIGAGLAKRYNEKPEIIDAIRGHHETTEPQFLYTTLVSAADAISASRPGARRESLERYVQRLERLETMAKEFEGVESAYAIQAGREVRVIVNADKVDDKVVFKLCRDIANKIEKEVSYPGEVKVTLLRERRVVEYAR